MVSFKSLLVAAASFVVVIAQTPIAFSSVPPVAVVGNTYNITWGGGDGTPVALTLRKGDPNNLDTISIIASRVTGTSYAWTVPDNLESATDYALQITQGVSGINYSGLFSIVGGTGTSSISYTGVSRTATSNSTATEPGTIVTAGMTQARTTASMGTGTAMPRNTTFSSQSLSATRTITTAASSSSASSRAATSVQQQTAAPSGNVGATLGSSAAMVIGLFGAIMFLH